MANNQAPALKSSVAQATTIAESTSQFSALADSDVARFFAISLPDFMPGGPVGRTRDEPRAAACETRTI